MLYRPARAPAALQSRPPLDFDKILAAASKALVDLAPIEWDGDASNDIAVAISDKARAFDRECSMAVDVRCRRIRDRYMGARFPGAVRSASDLDSPNGVIKSARHYFEDGCVETAVELLDLAIAQNPAVEALWLAQLEILFLAGDAKHFTVRATAFRATHAGSTHWAEVMRLGQSLAPDEALFGARRGPRNHEHYGPWPHLPNWIQANWDLTSEVLASDFHRLLMRGPSALAA